MSIHQKYGLRRVINACGKMTKLAGAIVLPEIVTPVTESLQHFYDLDELQAAAGRIISQTWGSESGCVTACTSAGITLSVAACMTGNSLANVLQLPDTSGMPNRVVIQKGHCVNYGAPITQSIQLSGATVCEVGSVNKCSEAELKHAVQQDGIAAIVAVESHHTVRHGWVRLPEMVRIAKEVGVPVIVDGAAQDHRLAGIIELGVDLAITSAHKYLCSTTGGVVVGRADLIEAVYLQNRGIGRGMKAGKEAIVGAMAALEFRQAEDIAAWTAEQDRKVEMILKALADVPGLGLSVDADPNGCPFSRAKLIPDETAKVNAMELTAQLAEGDPTIVARAHHADEGYIYIDAIEMTDEEIEYTCKRVHEIMG